MSDEFDPYKPGTGLKDDFDGYISDANFTTDPQTGRCTLILMFMCDDGEEYPVRYGIGSEWDTYDGGETVQHPKGERQLFNNSTAYSDFMVHAMESGAKEAMYSRLKAGLGPRAAANWKGFRFHMEVLDRPSRTRDQETNEWKDAIIQRTLPTKFYGIEGQERLDINAAAGTAAAAPSATTDPLSVLDTVTRAKVVRAAKESDRYETFIDVVLGLCDQADVPIMENAVIGQAVADEEWYNTLRNG